MFLTRLFKKTFTGRFFNLKNTNLFSNTKESATACLSSTRHRGDCYGPRRMGPMIQYIYMGLNYITVNFRDCIAFHIAAQNSKFRLRH